MSSTETPKLTGMARLRQEVVLACATMNEAADVIESYRSRVNAVLEEAAAAGVTLPALDALASDLDKASNALDEQLKDSAATVAETSGDARHERKLRSSAMASDKLEALEFVTSELLALVFAGGPPDLAQPLAQALRRAAADRYGDGAQRAHIDRIVDAAQTRGGEVRAGAKKRGSLALLIEDPAERERRARELRVGAEQAEAQRQKNVAAHAQGRR